MKKSTFSIIALLTCIFFLSSFIPLGKPVFEFDKTTHDFGDVKEGEVVTTIFTFTNTGDSPLIINNIITPCGCTTPEYDKGTPVLPGEQSQIKVVFKTKGKRGKVYKKLSILSNLEETTFIQITANILLN